VIFQTQGDFWASYNPLPVEVQQQTREKYRLWQTDAFNGTLHDA
jgi:hypothetical protein